MTASDHTTERAGMTAHDYVIEWCAQLGIVPGAELVRAAVTDVDSLLQRGGAVSREEAYGAAQAAMLNWVEETISGQPSTTFREVY